ncbi:MAG: hypothetical protein QHH06_15420 [Clostridiales bacterium]|nr:hypothetical protein [Eubacteriales bacterium]MDH7567825.1 hypothetical protein [Clostridiales bacterium]
MPASMTFWVNFGIMGAKNSISLKPFLSLVDTISANTLFQPLSSMAS